jgi:uncharacterized protein YeeX (DUF496 family)
VISGDINSLKSILSGILLNSENALLFADLKLISRDIRYQQISNFEKPINGTFSDIISYHISTRAERERERRKISTDIRYQVIS